MAAATGTTAEIAPGTGQDRAGLRVGWPLLLGLPILSGFLVWASFFVPALVWVSIVPLSLLVRLEGRRGWIYFGAWLGGLALFLPGTYWICYCARWVWVGWLFLGAYLAIYFPAFVLLVRICNRRWKVANVFAIPLVWVGLEYLRGHFLSGFGWLMLAHSIYRHEWTIQIADVAGVYGVSYVIATFNAIVVELLTLPIFTKIAGVGSQFNPALQWRLAVAGLVVCLNVGYGQYRVDHYKPREGPTCVVLQTNVPQDVRNYDSERALAYVRDIHQGAKDIAGDVVIWPETTYPEKYGRIAGDLTDLEVATRYMKRITTPGYPPDREPTEELGRILRQNFRIANEELESFAMYVGKPILIGTLCWDIRFSGARETNSSALIVPGKGELGRYDKVHLLPFGEYIPLGGKIPLIKYFTPYRPEFNYDSDAGEQVRGIHYGKLHLAPLICFEDTVPYVTRRYMQQATKNEPVEILVNQSNDGWFNNSIEGRYHLAAAVYRCVESRRPMVRSSNTGLSGLVDSNGKVVKEFSRNGKKQGVDGYLRVQVPLDDRDAPYVLVGDWLPWIGLAIAGTLAMASFLRTAIVFRREWRGQGIGSRE